jgi:hypothetical protein
MAIKTDTFTGGGGGGGGAVDSVNGDTGAVIVTLDGVTDQNAVTTNSVTVGGVTVGTAYSLPTADGTTGQAITTNGSGALSFTTVSSAVTSVNTLTGAVVVSGNDIAADHSASNYTAANANIDGHLSGIDTKLGTLVSGMTYQGGYDATNNLPSLANTSQGDFYIITTGGTRFGRDWAVGDHLVINEDMGGVVSNGKIDKIDNTDAVASVNGLTGVVVVSGDDIAADHSASNYTAANANVDGHLSGIDTKFGTLGTASTAASSDFLQVSNNLSDLNNATTARSNLGLGTAAVEDVGTTAGDLVQLDGTAKLPAVDGSQLTNLPSAPVTSVNTLTGAVVVSGNDIAADHTASNYTAANANVDGHLSGIDTKFGTLGTASTAASTDFLQVSNNLSDLNNAVTARSNLGLGTAATSASTDFLASTAGLDDLSDVAYTAGPGIDNYVLTYDHASTSWGAEAAASGGLSEVVQDTTPQLGGDLDVNGNSITSAGNANVLINPAGTGDISIGADLIPDADATHTIGDEDNRYISYYGDMNGAIRFKAKNAQGAQITKGQAVYISGVSGTVPEVQLARANSASTMPAFGLVYATANAAADVEIVTFGNLTDYDTTTYSLSANDTVFVSAATAGALTNTAPTGETNLIQNIGRVVRADASAGIIKAGGAGRSNATPNLDDGKIFLGNASNQAVSTALSAVNLSSFNNDSGFITSVASASETVEGIIEIATNVEADAATATDKALVPSNISSFDLADMNNTTSGFIANINSESLNDLSDVAYTAGAGIDNYVLTYDHATTSWGAEAAAGGGSAPSVTTDSSGTDTTISTVTGIEEIHLINNSTNNVVITIPTGATAGAGYKYNIKRLGTGTVSVTPASGTIDTVASFALDLQFSSVTVVSSGANWFVV